MVVVPLIQMYAAYAAGAAIVAGAAVTVGSFLTIAGGMMAGLGMISGDKDFKRIGGYLSLAGGLASGAQSLAAEGAGEASAAFDVPDGSMDAAENARLTRSGSAATPAAAPAAAPAAQAAPAAEPSLLRTPGDAADLGYADPGPSVQASAPAEPSLLERTAQSQTAADVQATLARTQQTAAAQAAQAGQATASTAPVTPGEAPSLFQSAQDAMKGVGSFIKTNPQASEMMFRTMAGYAQDRNRADEFAYRRSLMEQAQRNANSPVRMGYYPAGGPAKG